MSDLGERMVEHARSMLKTPWHHQARLPGVGIDCVGLVILSGQAAGIPMKDYVSNYPLKMNGRWLYEALALHYDQVPKEGPLLVGDVLAFAMALDYWHVGLVTQAEPLKMIHSYRSVGYCVENGVDAVWRKRIRSVWRLHG